MQATGLTNHQLILLSDFDLHTELMSEVIAQLGQNLQVGGLQPGPCTSRIDLHGIQTGVQGPTNQQFQYNEPFHEDEVQSG